VASTAAAPEVLQLLPDLQWQQEILIFDGAGKNAGFK